MHRNKYALTRPAREAVDRRDSRGPLRPTVVIFAIAIAVPSLSCRDTQEPAAVGSASIEQTLAASASMNPAVVARHGKTIFRFDTFGDGRFAMCA